VIIAVYSTKGGVGKTTLAVNLAWASARLSGHRTLLWDLAFDELGKRKRLAKLLDDFLTDYDRILIDCAPGLGSTSEQILRAADLIVVPVIPSPLSLRALDEVKEHAVTGKGPGPRLAPVFSMVDRWRALHCCALEDQSAWPVIPMSSAYERVSDERHRSETCCRRRRPQPCASPNFGNDWTRRVSKAPPPRTARARAPAGTGAVLLACRAAPADQASPGRHRLDGADRPVSCRDLASKLPAPPGWEAPARYRAPPQFRPFGKAALTLGRLRTCP